MTDGTACKIFETVSSPQVYVWYDRIAQDAKKCPQIFPFLSFARAGIRNLDYLKVQLLFNPVPLTHPMSSSNLLAFMPETSIS